MDAETIIAQLSRFKGLPREALRAAADDRALLAPRFIRIIENYLALPAAERPVETPIFFIFHLLGDWRERTAYRPLARLLRLPDAEIGHILGDAVTSTSNRVITAVFDGDPQPIFDIILDTRRRVRALARMRGAVLSRSHRPDRPPHPMQLPARLLHQLEAAGPLLRVGRVANVDRPPRPRRAHLARRDGVQARLRRFVVDSL
jgi:hypothetical protein